MNLDDEERIHRAIECSPSQEVIDDLDLLLSNDRRFKAMFDARRIPAIYQVVGTNHGIALPNSSMQWQPASVTHHWPPANAQQLSDCQTECHWWHTSEAAAAATPQAVSVAVSVTDAHLAGGATPWVAATPAGTDTPMASTSMKSWLGQAATPAARSQTPKAVKTVGNHYVATTQADEPLPAGVAPMAWVAATPETDEPPRLPAAMSCASQAVAATPQAVPAADGVDGVNVILAGLEHLAVIVAGLQQQVECLESRVAQMVPPPPPPDGPGPEPSPPPPPAPQEAPVSSVPDWQVVTEASAGGDDASGPPPLAGAPAKEEASPPLAGAPAKVTDVVWFQ